MRNYSDKSFLILSKKYQSLPTVPKAPSSSLGPVGMPISSNVRGCALPVSCCGSMPKGIIKGRGVAKVCLTGRDH